MDLVTEIVVLGRSARNSANIKNRQPIGKMYYMAKELPVFYQEIIKEELNIKEIQFTEDVSQFTTYSFKPQLKVLGQKYGKKIGEIRTVLAELDGKIAKKELDTIGVMRISLKDGDINLISDDLLIEAKQLEGSALASDRGITVVIETTLSEELLEEGFVREITSKIQMMRKESDFNVMDNIIVFVKCSNKIAKIITDNIEIIKNDVLAHEINFSEIDNGMTQWDINGEAVEIAVQRA